jgi:LPS export ABC transporter protein LptC
MIKQKSKPYLFNLLLVTISFTTLFSCVNDLETIKKVASKSDAPEDVTENLEIMYTDSGLAQFQLFAKLAETYIKPVSVTKLKDGLKINFFDEKGNIVSSLTALYGEINTEAGTFYAKDSVELYNFEFDQKLETEELTWKQKDSSIVTDKPVIVTTKNGILFGTGLESKQDFSKYTFKKPTGRINLKEEK